MKKMFAALALTLLCLVGGPAWASPAQGAGAGSENVPGVVDGPRQNQRYTKDAPTAPGSLTDQGNRNGVSPPQGGPRNGTNVYNGQAPAGYDNGPQPSDQDSWFTVLVIVGLFVLIAIVAGVGWYGRRSAPRHATDLR